MWRDQVDAVIPAEFVVKDGNAGVSGRKVQTEDGTRPSSWHGPVLYLEYTNLFRSTLGARDALQSLVVARTAIRSMRLLVSMSTPTAWTRSSLTA